LPSIVNVSLCKALGDKGNELTYTTVKQENLAEMEIWATTLGYTWKCMYAPLQVLHWQCSWEKNLNAVMYWKSKKNVSVNH